MSGFTHKLQTGAIFNRAAYAGPRRFLVIGGVIVVVAVGVLYVSMSGTTPPPASQVSHLPVVNPLPGGLNSTPQQEKLALQADRELADEASRNGQSSTPPMSASSTTVPASTPAPATTQPIAAPTTLHPVSPSPPDVAAKPLQYAGGSMAQPISQSPPDPQEQQAYREAVNRLLRGWNGRSPQTDVVLQPLAAQADASSGGLASNEAGQTAGEGGNAQLASMNTRPGNASGDSSTGRVILSAGRGVYAHTVLAVSSDSEGPVVLQADSGPLAGDRMIGTFAKATSNGTGAADRLIVRINSIEHQGHSIPVDAIVTAPETMETTVASSVDQHYLARFGLPAAAAFIQGLGQALATTSNTVGVLSPLGGTSYATQLNFPQQIGIGAGVAAQQIGNTLNRQAPTGPTIHLEANVSVGVMFLAPVTENRQFQQ